MGIPPGDYHLPNKPHEALRVRSSDADPTLQLPVVRRIENAESAGTPNQGLPGQILHVEESRLRTRLELTALDSQAAQCRLGWSRLTPQVGNHSLKL